MEKNKLKKIIASTLLLTSAVMIGVGVIDKTTKTVQADDWDDYYDDRYDDDMYDDYDEVFEGNLSVSEFTNYLGTSAVTVKIPAGLKIIDSDIDGEPHHGINEIINGDKIVIYGLRNGMSYNSLILTLEDTRGIEHKYHITPFNLQGSSNTTQPQRPVLPSTPPAMKPPADQIYGDNIFKGELPIAGITTYLGRPAVNVKVPDGLIVRDTDIDGEPHDGIEEILVGNTVTIFGLRNGIPYNNLILTLEDNKGIDYKYRITPFTLGSQNTSKPQVSVVPPTTNRPTTSSPSNVTNYLDKVYKNVFDRSGDTDGLSYWTQQLTSGKISLEDFFKNLLSEGEFLTKAPTIEDKITKLYHGIFERTPDRDGFNYWTQKYSEILSVTGDEKETLKIIINHMTNGDEFRELLSELGLQ